MRAGLQPGQDAVGQIKSIGNANEAEAGVWEVRPFKDGVEDILGFAVKLVHLIQDKKPGGRKTEPQPSPRHYLGRLASQPRQETHTEGPGADRNLCSPFCPPGAFSLLARSGKMA